jgi:hypothetical protein
MGHYMDGVIAEARRADEAEKQQKETGHAATNAFYTHQV